MPGWALAIGEIFPLTRFLRLVRGWPTGSCAHLRPLRLFAVVVMAIGSRRP